MRRNYLLVFDTETFRHVSTCVRDILGVCACVCVAIRMSKGSTEMSKCCSTKKDDASTICVENYFY